MPCGSTVVEASGARLLAHDPKQITLAIPEERHPQVVGLHVGDDMRLVLERHAALTQRLVSCELDAAAVDIPLWGQILPHIDTPMALPGSTEVGDVSQITPTGQLTTCCWPLGTPGHSWQIVASSGSSIGFKGMLLAAKALALTGLDLLTRPDVLAEAQAEFARKINGRSYRSPLSEGAVPH